MTSAFSAISALMKEKNNSNGIILLTIYKHTKNYPNMF